MSEANEVGRDAVQDLVTILDYFDDAGREIKVSDLPASKKEFILKAFTSARDKVPASCWCMWRYFLSLLRGVVGILRLSSAAAL